MTVPAVRPRRSAVTFARRLLRGQEGSTAVEFAIILPVLLLILLGIVQFGFLFVIHTAMANAAREEARWIALAGGNIAGHDVTASVEQRLGPWTDSFPGAFTVVSSPPAAPPAENVVYVEVSFDLSRIAFGGLISGFAGNSISARVAQHTEE